jgi:hypothetical protein
MIIDAPETNRGVVVGYHISMNAANGEHAGKYYTIEKYNEILNAEKKEIVQENIPVENGKVKRAKRI